MLAGKSMRTIQILSYNAVKGYFTEKNVVTNGRS